MSWSNFESEDGRIISINMDEVVSVINYKNDKADILLKNGCMHTVTFIGPWEPEEQINADPEDELHPMNEVIQDLKLENDRLKQREALMIDFISSVSCTLKQCRDCKLNRSDKFDELGAKCAYLQSGSGMEYIRTEAYNLIKRLEDL